MIVCAYGFKTTGEGAHKELVDYLSQHYPSFSEQEIKVIDELRFLRNKIAYDGFFITFDYVERNNNSFKGSIHKLKGIIKKKGLS